MGNGFIIFVIVSIVWAIISRVAEASAKAKQEEARRQAGGGRTSSTASTSGRPASGAPAGGGQARGTDLVARRREQLEELRRRRAQGGGATASRPPGQSQTRAQTQSQTQVRHAPTAQPTRLGPGASPTSRSGIPMPSPIASTTARDNVQRKAREARGRADAEQGRRDMKKAAEQLRRKQQEAARRNRPATKPAVAPAPAAEWGKRERLSIETDVVAKTAVDRSEADAYRERRTRRSAGGVRGALRSRASLRQLIVLKEILDPPIAMRRPE